ncbi:MAG: hypothetical protein FWC79_04865 [Oscillospiraceae bacterium]|nr:hypothetical protein [Oscillospiraceae bacterium]
MSNETEVKILEGLSSINSEIKGINNEINGINSEIKGINSEIKGINIRLDRHEKRLDTQNAKMDTEFAKNTKYFVTNNSHLKDMKETINSISNSVAVIEYDHGRKIDTIYQEFTTNRERHVRMSYNVDELKETTEKHSIEIEHLKNKISKIG